MAVAEECDTKIRLQLVKNESMTYFDPHSFILAASSSLKTVQSVDGVHGCRTNLTFKFDLCQNIQKQFSFLSHTDVAVTCSLSEICSKFLLKLKEIYHVMLFWDKMLLRLRNFKTNF